MRYRSCRAGILGFILIAATADLEDRDGRWLIVGFSSK